MQELQDSRLGSKQLARILQVFEEFRQGFWKIPEPFDLFRGGKIRYLVSVPFHLREMRSMHRQADQKTALGCFRQRMILNSYRRSRMVERCRNHSARQAGWAQKQLKQDCSMQYHSSQDPNQKIETGPRRLRGIHDK